MKTNRLNAGIKDTVNKMLFNARLHEKNSKDSPEKTMIAGFNKIFLDKINTRARKKIFN